MVERRQARTANPADEVESSPEEAERDRTLERLPGDLSALKSIEDDGAKELLELAERQVADTRRRLGPKTEKPRLRRVAKMFNDAARRPPQVGEELAHIMRNGPVAGEVAVLDGAFDDSLAIAYNLFDKASVHAGAMVQIAYDDWTMAVRIYKSELRAAGAILFSSVEAAKHAAWDDEYDPPLRGETQVTYYARADRIGIAVLTYERRILVAGKNLADAYAELITALFDSTNALAVAEATLIATTQAANKTFWTGVQSAIAHGRG